MKPSVYRHISKHVSWSTLSYVAAYGLPIKCRTELPVGSQTGVSDHAPSAWQVITEGPVSVCPSLQLTVTTEPNAVPVEFTDPPVGVGSPQSMKIITQLHNNC